MKVTLFMAVSLNGIIARENNEEDFLSEINWKTLIALANKTKCIVWGKKTYEIVKTWEQKYLDDLKETKKIIVSGNSDYKPKTNTEYAISPEDAIQKLEKQGFKGVILTGGSTINSAFAQKDLISEVIININPIIIGKGIPLFNPSEFDLKLKLLETKTLPENILQLRYKVE